MSDDDRLEKRLDAIGSRRLHLHDEDLEANEDNRFECHRPNIRVYASLDLGEPHVTICIEGMWGQQMRFVELTAREAGVFASDLAYMAAKVQKAVEIHKCQLRIDETVAEKEEA